MIKLYKAKQLFDNSDIKEKTSYANFKTILNHIGTVEDDLFIVLDDESLKDLNPFVHFEDMADRLLELYRVFTGYLKFSVSEALEVVNFYQNSNRYTILYSNLETSFQTFQFAQLYNAKSGKIFDLDVLSTAVCYKIDEIYTKNTKDFPKDTSVKIMDPIN